jgi:hypothetical protein
MATSKAIQEIESVEANDALHDFGGPHSGKGSDFAQYWLIGRIIELERTSEPDYLFVCEYVQDVAEFDSSSEPTSIRLYQLKKKEGAYWKVHELTGQTQKRAAPIPDKPVIKLLRHVRKFTTLKSTGAFISNGKFDVVLASGQSSINDPVVGLHLLDAVHADAIRAAIAAEEGIPLASVNLDVIELQNTSLAIDDLDRHTYGVMLDFLSARAPEHAAQAQSFVDALFSRIRARARRTGKSTDWVDLVERRGFGRQNFKDAVESLEALPDKVAFRLRLYEKLSKDWSVHRAARVLAALTRCAREKVLVGVGNRWAPNPEELSERLATAVALDQPDQMCFDGLCDYLAAVLPALGSDEISALAIYEMTEWASNQTQD